MFCRELIGDFMDCRRSLQGFSKLYIHGDNMCFLHYQPQNIGNLYVVYMFRANCLLFLTFRSHRLSNMPYSTCRRSVFGDGKIEKLRSKLPSGVIKHDWKIPEIITYGGLQLEKITYKWLGFSGKPCLITRGYSFCGYTHGKHLEFL